MTLVFGYRIPSQEPNSALGVIVGSDTISTLSEPVYDSFATTSHNQIISPKMVDDVAQYFSENSCKIGVLNSNALVAASGNVGLINRVLKFYFEHPDQIRSYTDFFPKFTDQLCVSLSPVHDFPEGTVADLLFTLYDAGHVTFSSIIYIVENSALKHAGTYQFPGGTIPAYYRGSAHNLMSDFSGSFHFNVSMFDTKTIQPAITLETSNHISKKTGGYAGGVGGAILTLGLDAEGVQCPPDTIYMYADQSDKVDIITKVIYRDGLIYVMDFIEKNLRGFMTLDREFGRPPMAAEFLKPDYIKPAMAFDAEWLYLTRRLPDGAPGDKKFDVFAQGNASNQLVKGNAGNSLTVNNIKGSKLDLTLSGERGNKSFKLTVRN